MNQTPDELARQIVEVLRLRGDVHGVYGLNFNGLRRLFMITPIEIWNIILKMGKDMVRKIVQTPLLVTL